MKIFYAMTYKYTYTFQLNRILEDYCSFLCLGRAALVVQCDTYVILKCEKMKCVRRSAPFLISVMCTIFIFKNGAVGFMSYACGATTPFYRFCKCRTSADASCNILLSATVCFLWGVGRGTRWKNTRVKQQSQERVL